MTEHSDGPGANSAAIDAAVVERVADGAAVDADELATALVVLGADLTDAHHELERAFDYDTVDECRVYAADEDTWTEVLERNGVDELADPVRTAHREQAGELLGGEPPDAPVVVGVDTAEEIDEVPQPEGAGERD